MDSIEPLEPSSDPHIIVVSNRGPFSFAVRDSKIEATRGAGGLVTAMSAIARQQEVLWISAALSEGDRAWMRQNGAGPHVMENMKIRLVDPEPTAFDGYYNIISNSLLWFTQHQIHDTPRSPVIDESVWQAWREGYVRVNQQLAEAVAETIADLEGEIIVMPQDYHLYLFPQFLRELVGDRVTIQSFLHIPFPGPDAWHVLPLALRRDMMIAMLHADRLGFQTERDTRRFLQTAVETLPDVRVTKPWRQITFKGRVVEAVPYPISIDVAHLENQLQSDDVQEYVHALRNRYQDRRLILRIDRVEPSKNILRGFQAFQNFLTAYPEYHRKVEMLALLVPSRGDVPEYQAYLRDIMTMVGAINATLGDGEWEPVRVMLGNNYNRAIAAMSVYDVLMVNPLADGMNLVAKEGAVLNQRSGVLILSEQAGVAEEFGDVSLLVSPYDVYGTREAIHDALTMPLAERRERAQQLAIHTFHNDIYHWFDKQLRDARRKTIQPIATVASPIQAHPEVESRTPQLLEW
jgi:trehalose 6-phosphate synthase